MEKLMAIGVPTPADDAETRVIFPLKEQSLNIILLDSWPRAINMDQE
jgi:hypothetical protein